MLQDQYSQLLEPLDPKAFHSFSQLEANDVPKNSTDDCNRKLFSDTFKTLKGQFMDSLVPASFLQQLCENKPLLSVQDAQAEVDRLGQIATICKQELKNSKASCVNTENQVEDKAKSLISMLAQHREGRAALQDEIAKYNRLASKLHAYGISNNLTPQQVVDQCQARLQQQVSEIQAEEQRVSSSRSKLQDAKAKLERLQQQLADKENSAKQQVEQFQNQASPADQKLQERLAKLDAMKTWSVHMKRVLEKMSGVRVGELTEKSLSVFFQVGTQDFTIDLQFNPNDTRLLGANIHPARVNISDVVMEGIRCNDPRFLIREIRARVINNERLLEELATLRNKYALSFDEISKEVVITLPEGVVCSFVLPLGYPQLGFPAKVMSLNGFDGVQQNGLDDLVKALNANQDMHTLEHLLAGVLSKLTK